jgi:hypothetical protein
LHVIPVKTGNQNGAVLRRGDFSWIPAPAWNLPGQAFTRRDDG